MGGMKIFTAFKIETYNEDVCRGDRISDAVVTVESAYTVAGNWNV
jgi:hypothetical protein